MRYLIVTYDDYFNIPYIKFYEDYLKSMIKPTISCCGTAAATISIFPTLMYTKPGIDIPELEN